jgi:hypothetical protein
MANISNSLEALFLKVGVGALLHNGYGQDAMPHRKGEENIMLVFYTVRLYLHIGWFWKSSKGTQRVSAHENRPKGSIKVTFSMASV